MTTQTEALKLALEALESCDAAHITDGGQQWYDEKLVDTAYAATKEALAQQSNEQVELECYDAGLLGSGGGGDVDWWQDYIRSELGRAHDFYQSQVDTQPKEPEQDKECCVGCEACIDTACGRDECPNGWPKSPQRTWVGLTDEEILSWWSTGNGLEDLGMCNIVHFKKVIAEIETKLKEKNT